MKNIWNHQLDPTSISITICILGTFISPKSVDKHRNMENPPGPMVEISCYPMTTFPFPWELIFH